MRGHWGLCSVVSVSFFSLFFFLFSFLYEVIMQPKTTLCLFLKLCEEQFLSGRGKGNLRRWASTTSKSAEGESIFFFSFFFFFLFLQVFVRIILSFFQYFSALHFCSDAPVGNACALEDRQLRLCGKRCEILHHASSSSSSFSFEIILGLILFFLDHFLLFPFPFLCFLSFSFCFSFSLLSLPLFLRLFFLPELQALEDRPDF